MRKDHFFKSPDRVLLAVRTPADAEYELADVAERALPLFVVTPISLLRVRTTVRTCKCRLAALGCHIVHDSFPFTHNKK